MSPKIKNQDEILRIVDSLRKKGKTIVTYNGSFDILHKGHLETIKEAKKQGDILVILLNSDKSVESYKGPTRPINSQIKRAETLANLDEVDYVVIFNELNPKRLLSLIKPDVHCIGADWGDYPVEREEVERNGGKIHKLKWVEGYSTSLKIKEIYKENGVGAVFLDRDGTINYDKGYVHEISNFEFIPGAIDSLKDLSKTDYKIIVITDQSGIGRGYYSQQEFDNLNVWMLEKLKKEGVRIDRVYYCPHIDKDNCGCRKPKIGMLMNAVRDFGISLNKSWLIGDDKRDIIMGKEVNVRTIKIGEIMPKDLKLEPHYYAKNLKEAVDLILSNK